MNSVRQSYDALAATYADQLVDELAGKPLERALYQAFGELVTRAATGGAAPRVGDVGCGPGHVTAHLRELGLDAVGVDLSPNMIAEATHRFGGEFRVGSLLAPGGLGELDGAWAGAVAAYAIVHFDGAERRLAFAELARAVREGGWLLLSFHTSDVDHVTDAEQPIPPADQPEGGSRHVEELWGRAVDLDFYFLDPAVVTTDLAAYGFEVLARTDRAPGSGEVPTRRCHLLARRGG